MCALTKRGVAFVVKHGLPTKTINIFREKRTNACRAFRNVSLFFNRSSRAMTPRAEQREDALVALARATPRAARASREALRNRQ